MSRRGSPDGDHAEKQHERRERFGSAHSDTPARDEYRRDLRFVPVSAPRPPPEAHLTEQIIIDVVPPELPRNSSRRHRHVDRSNYAWVKKSRRDSRRYFEYHDPEQEPQDNYEDMDPRTTDDDDDDDDRIPDIQQSYQTPPSDSFPEPPPFQANVSYAQAPQGVHFASAPSVHFGRRYSERPERYTYDPPPPTGGPPGGGDIRIAAKNQPKATPNTLNKITICVYRNSKRQFVEAEVWLVKADFRGVRHPTDAMWLSDAAFFRKVRWKYTTQLRGTFRRYLSFKTVSTARILGYGDYRFGLWNVNDKIFSPAFMKIFDDPSGSLLDPKQHPRDRRVKKYMWVKWLWKLRANAVRKKHLDLAIELIEAYDPARVMGGIAIALSVYFTLTITWLAKGGDPSYVSGVMSFVLSILAVLVGLTGLYDWLDLGHMGGGKDFLILNDQDFKDMKKDAPRPYEDSGI
ncbi:hypothetical protein E4T39_02724 [Aureobasidium subglaciale]|nr:hypothetical protein E4T39_02724 [Aureobasidium subglaciale]